MAVYLLPVKTVNRWEIKQRSGKQARIERLPLYIVAHPDGRHMEEFRRLASAVKWCRANTDLVS